MYNKIGASAQRYLLSHLKVWQTTTCFHHLGGHHQVFPFGVTTLRGLCTSTGSR